MLSDRQFRNKIQTQKGNIGQRIFRQHMAKVHPKYKVYPHSDQNIGSHQFDGMILKDGEVVFLYDVKTKPRRYRYQDTGVDFRSYKTYIKSAEKNKKPFVLVFVDEYTGQIYFGFLSKLSQKKIINGNEYPLMQHASNGDQIIYFPLQSMRILDDLTDEEQIQIKSKTSMNLNHKRLYNGRIKTVKQILDEKNGNLF